MDEERAAARHRDPSGRGAGFPWPKFLVTLAVGLALELFLQGVRWSGRLDRLQDLGADVAMSGFRNVVSPLGPTPPFVFVDADESSYRAWQEPVLFPRAKLARLIDRVLAAKPKLLVVDVDLSRSDPEGDGALGETLTRRGADTAGAPVLLVRGLRPPSPELNEVL